MFARRLVNLLIALSVAAGLLSAPLAAPSFAKSGPSIAIPAGDMQAMAEDMPCCPDQQDQKAKDCGSCPFIVLCMLTITLPPPDRAVLVHRQSSRSVFALPDDRLTDGLGEHPPDHPPRTSV